MPLTFNDKKPVPGESFLQVRKELVEAFGGVTLYRQSPAEGLWEDEKGEIEQDSLLIAEVISPAYEPAWWQPYKAKLESRFRQKEIMIRVLKFEKV